MILPKQVQQWLEKKNWYLRLRYSKIIYQLWLLMRSDVRKKLAADAIFYQEALPKNLSLIFDIGANEGVLTQLFGEVAQCVVAVEPAERNVAILRAKFSSQTNILILPLAVSSEEGKQLWYANESDYAMGTLSRKWNDNKGNQPSNFFSQTIVQTTTLDSLIAQYGLPDYVKIDVEGSEWQVLQGLSHGIALLSFEAILPQFSEETIQCIERLCFLSPACAFNYVQDHHFVYQDYIDKPRLLADIKNIHYTIDIWCRL